MLKPAKLLLLQFSSFLISRFLLILLSLSYLFLHCSCTDSYLSLSAGSSSSVNMSAAHSDSDEEQYAEDVPNDVPRGSWEGSSDVTNEHINWLYASRRIPPSVICRIPVNEVEPNPEEGERVVFLAHFQRGFGLVVFCGRTRNLVRTC